MCTYNTLAQKIIPDTLTMGELKLFREKATTQRNVGMIFSLSGMGMLVTALALETYYSSNNIPEYVPILVTEAGLVSTIFGSLVWWDGARRKTLTESYKITISNLYVLNMDEFNVSQAKSIKNVGMILTLSGLSLATTGLILELATDDFSSYYSSILGFSTAVIGFPLWGYGSRRKADAEFNLQQLNIQPENSMALGVGLTIRF